MADSPLVAAPAVTGGRDELGGGAVALPVGTGTDVMVPGTVTEAVSDSVWGGAVSVSVGCVSVGWLSEAVSVCVGVTVLVSVWVFVWLTVRVVVVAVASPVQVRPRGQQP